MGDVTTFESAFETSAGARPRRMDVVPAGRDRRSWTPEAKARIIAESMAPRANVADIARRNNMLPQQLYAWRRGARERMEAGDDTAFVPAVVDQPARPARAGAEIRIDLRGVTIRVPDGVSADHIERVLLAVQVAM
ncbi:MAG: transposase [Sphingomonas sp.]